MNEAEWTRAGALYAPIMVALLAGALQTNRHRQLAACLLSGLWALCSLLAVQRLNELAGWWSYSGAGVLLVTGNLTFNGNPNYNGLILVIGKGSVTKNGGGNGTVNGSLLVANLYNSANPPQLLPASSVPGIPTLNWNGGGSVSWKYDSCWSTILNGLQAYRIVAVREMMY